MDNNDILLSRIRDLANKCYQNEYVTHTDFLSVSEQAALYDAMRNPCAAPHSGRINGTAFYLWGGFEDAERKVCAFLPSWLDKDSFLMQENDSPQIMTCLHIKPVQAKFADELTHRDFLGALMNLGIGRSQVGDILIDRNDRSAYCFILKKMADYVISELCRVRHTTVLAEEIVPGKCTARPEFEDREGSVPSERLDAVLAFVFRLARGRAQELIEKEAVIADGHTAVSGGYSLKPGTRVSVRGFGKFIYSGVISQTKKGRLFIRVRVYK